MNRRQALAALVAMPEVARITKANVTPSDVIVIEVQGYVTTEHGHRLVQTLRAIWPDQRILVLEGGTTIKVISEENSTGGGA